MANTNDWTLHKITHTNIGGPSIPDGMSEITKYLNDNLSNIHPAFIKLASEAVRIHGPNYFGYQSTTYVAYKDSPGKLPDTYQLCPAPSTQEMIVIAYKTDDEKLEKDLNSLTAYNQILSNVVMKKDGYGTQYLDMLEVQNDLIPFQEAVVGKEWKSKTNSGNSYSIMEEAYKSAGEHVSPFCIKACLSDNGHSPSFSVFYTESTPVSTNGNDEIIVPYANHDAIKWHWSMKMCTSAADVTNFLNTLSPEISFLCKICALGYNNWHSSKGESYYFVFYPRIFWALQFKTPWFLRSYKGFRGRYHVDTVGSNTNTWVFTPSESDNYYFLSQPERPSLYLYYSPNEGLFCGKLNPQYKDLFLWKRIKDNDSCKLQNKANSLYIQGSVGDPYMISNEADATSFKMISR